MKMKKIISASLACAVCASSFVSAFAKDNVYAYNKFISTIIGPQVGYCDFAASFAGHESEYGDVKEYFSGLISAFYRDIDCDFDNELITVESTGVSVYQSEEKGVVFLGSVDLDMIANFGNSYANVFVVPRTTTMTNKEYLGVETYGETENIYKMYLYELDHETDELKKIFEAVSEDNEDGAEKNVWANNKTYYSYTNGGGIESTINPEGYKSWDHAAWKALYDTAKIDTAETGQRETAKFEYDTVQRQKTELKTAIRATGLRFTEKPVVIFEDYSNLSELKIKPDIVTVVVDGKTLQFPNQDPMIIDGRTLVPVRTIMEEFGAQVDWIDADGKQKIVVNTADKNITMTINSKEFLVNGERREDLDVPAQLINDKTLVPFRAISESLGCKVEWEQETKTVTITSAEE